MKLLGAIELWTQTQQDLKHTLSIQEQEPNYLDSCDEIVCSQCMINSYVIISSGMFFINVEGITYSFILYNDQWLSRFCQVMLSHPNFLIEVLRCVLQEMNCCWSHSAFCIQKLLLLIPRFQNLNPNIAPNRKGNTNMQNNWQKEQQKGDNSKTKINRVRPPILALKFRYLPSQCSYELHCIQNNFTQQFEKNSSRRPIIKKNLLVLNIYRH